MLGTAPPASVAFACSPGNMPPFGLSAYPGRVAIDAARRTFPAASAPSWSRFHRALVVLESGHALAADGMGCPSQ